MEITDIGSTAGLETNHFNKEKCQDAFDSYKACKKQEVREIVTLI